MFLESVPMRLIERLELLTRVMPRAIGRSSCGCSSSVLIIQPAQGNHEVRHTF